MRATSSGLTIGVMRRLGLSKDLVRWIGEGRLFEQVQAAQAEYRQLCAAMAAWELAHPEAAAQVPWREAREAWKRAGSPDPAWWELLGWYGDSGNFTPLRRTELTNDMSIGRGERARLARQARGVASEQ